ncbi:MAG: hypothetical protein ACO3VS_13475, partial [Limisphaerales bacterium]
MSHLSLHSLLAGEPIEHGERILVKNPYTGAPAGEVSTAGIQDTKQAIQTALEQAPALTRYQRFEILDQ